MLLLARPLSPAILNFLQKSLEKYWIFIFIVVGRSFPAKPSAVDPDPAALGRRLRDNLPWLHHRQHGLRRQSRPRHLHGGRGVSHFQNINLVKTDFPFYQCICNMYKTLFSKLFNVYCKVYLIVSG